MQHNWTESFFTSPIEQTITMEKTLIRTQSARTWTCACVYAIVVFCIWKEKESYGNVFKRCARMRMRVTFYRCVSHDTANCTKGIQLFCNSREVPYFDTSMLRIAVTMHGRCSWRQKSKLFFRILNVIGSGFDMVERYHVGAKLNSSITFL